LNNKKEKTKKIDNYTNHPKKYN